MPPEPTCGSASCPRITNHGGGLLSNPRVYLVTFTARERRLAALPPQLPSQLPAVTRAAFAARGASWWLDEYHVLPGAFAGAIQIQNRTLATARTINDDALASALRAARQARTLPSPAAALYVVVTRANQGVYYYDQHGRETSASDFCGYHSTSGAPNSRPFAYIVLPNETGNLACSAGLTATDTWTYTYGHELAEALTDPFGNGWFGPPPHDDEIADICETELPSVRVLWLHRAYFFPRLYDKKRHRCRAW